MPELVDRWTLTPAESFSHFVPVAAREDGVEPKAPAPFDCPRKHLDGTAFTYHLVVSETSKNTEVLQIAAARPKLQRGADNRSGVIVYDGITTVGAYLVLGHRDHATRRIWVHQDYRNQGVAARTVQQWFRETPHSKNSKQPINLFAAKAFLNAHENVVAWAQGKGFSVPQQVVDAIASGAERAQVLQAFEGI